MKKMHSRGGDMKMVLMFTVFSCSFDVLLSLKKRSEVEDLC